MAYARAERQDAVELLASGARAHRIIPAAAARQYARRDAYMARLLERELLGRDANARVLVFMGG